MATYQRETEIRSEMKRDTRGNRTPVTSPSAILDERALFGRLPLRVCRSTRENGIITPAYVVRYALHACRLGHSVEVFPAGWRRRRRILQKTMTAHFNAACSMPSGAQ